MMIAAGGRESLSRLHAKRALAEWRGQDGSGRRRRCAREGGTLCTRSPKVDTVDTTGAGDAFVMQGLLTAYLMGKTVKNACVAGASAAGSQRALPEHCADCRPETS